jgi:uncharacterized protein (DUF433 family)
MIHYADYITVDPQVCHGQPCFKGTRIMTYLVLELLEAGVGIDEIQTRYYRKLTPNYIKAALHYAAELMKAGESVPFAKVA